jgi:hypothetical protein
MKTSQQIWCFGPDGLLPPCLRDRHPRPATGLLHATGYRNVDGIVIPTTRHGYAWQGDYQSVPEPLLVAIDMSTITIR